MVKLILTVPLNFNAALFLDVVTDVVNSNRDNADGNYKYEYSLGDCINWRISQNPNFKEYEIDAALIDFEVIDVIKKMQELCPLVDIHCENDNAPASKTCRDDEFYYNDAYYELFKSAGVQCFKHLG